MSQLISDAQAPGLSALHHDVERVWSIPTRIIEGQHFGRTGIDVGPSPMQTLIRRLHRSPCVKRVFKNMPVC